MYQAKVTLKLAIEPSSDDVAEADKEGETVAQEYTDINVTLKSKTRGLMFSLAKLCRENDIPCEVSVVAEPKVVRFKGIDD